jgi:uncharacterized delta-60 repeat protein
MKRTYLAQFIPLLLLIAFDSPGGLPASCPPVLVDSSFDPGTGTDALFVGNPINRIVPMADGRIFIAGDFSSVQSQRRAGIARLLADGSVDTGFSATLSTLPVEDMAPAPDGKLYLAGAFGAVNGLTRNGLVRFNINGTVDAAFSPALSAGAWVRGIAVQDTGRILALRAQSGSAAVVRLNTNGALDNTFTMVSAGTEANPTIRALATHLNGTVLVGGWFTNLLGRARIGLARLQTNGQLDTNFVADLPGFQPLASVVTLIRVQSDGRILLAGENCDRLGGGLVRLNTDGSLDGSFQPPLRGFRPGDVLPLPDGRILISGNIRFVDGSSAQAALLYADGSRVSGFDLGLPALPVGMPSQVEPLAVQPNGRLLIAGSFHSIAGVARAGMARLWADPAGLSEVAFRAARVAVSETNLFVTLTVVRRGDCSGPLSVELATSNLTAVAGTDYAPTNVTLNFGPMETEKTLDIAIVDNLVADGNRSFAAVLDHSSGATLGAEPSAFIEILDDETPVVIDPSFNADLPPDCGIARLWPAPDGKLLVLQGCGGGGSLQLRRLRTDGSADPDFNQGNGVAVNDMIWDLAIQPDGRVVLVGNFTTVRGVTRPRVARLNANGSIDGTFNPGSGFAPGDVYSLVIQADGRIVVGGNFTSYNGASRSYLARLNTNGVLDTSFTTTLGGSPGFPVKLAQQADGKILLCGYFTTVSGSSRPTLARLGTNGVLEATFAPTFTRTPTGSPYVGDILVQDDGRILIGGAFDTVNGVARRHMARLNSNGSLDATFDAGLVSSLPNLLTMFPDGRVALAGVPSLEFSDGSSHRFVVLKADGSRASDFPLPGEIEIGEAAIDAAGNLLVSGSFVELNGYPTAGLARVPLEATAVRAISLQGFTVTTGEGAAFALVSVRRFGDAQTTASVLYTTFNESAFADADYTVTSGTLTFAPGENAATIAVPLLDDHLEETNESFRVVLSDPSPGTTLGLAETRVWIRDNDRPGSLDFTFDPQPGAIAIGSVEALALQPDGKVFAITRHPELNLWHLRRFNPDGSEDATFAPYPAARFHALPDGPVLAVRHLRLLGASLVTDLVRLHPDGTEDPTFHVIPGGNFDPDSFGSDAPLIQNLSVLPDGRIIIFGKFNRVNGVARNHIARLWPDGTVDADFNAGSGPDGLVQIGTLLPDGKLLIGGEFTAVNGTARNGIARLNSNGTLDGGFNPGSGFTGSDGYASVSQILLQPDGRAIVTGYFDAFNGSSRGGVARLNTNGSLDATFTVGAGARFVADDGSIFPAGIWAAALQRDGKIVVGGGFNQFNNLRVHGVVRLNPNGSRDGAFDPGTAAGLFGDVLSLAIQPDGDVLLGGMFPAYAEIARPGFARVNGDFAVRITALTRSTDGHVQVTVQSQPGKSYTLQASEDLVSWLNRATSVATGGALTLEDEQATGAVHRFYRVARP